jgi:hypothetical protein
MIYPQNQYNSLNPQEDVIPYQYNQNANYTESSIIQTQNYQNYQPLNNQIDPRSQEQLDEQKIVEEMILNDPFNDDRKNKGLGGFFRKLFGN